jgi:2-keto-4-pentenoate hydratase/2-oxohepta-3-ene-1,7-dioic acid hydratase in catechol pathway
MNSTSPTEPILFLKPASSIIFTDEPIILPQQSHSVHHEVELGVVISKDGTHIEESQAMDYVYGYLLGLDITARDIQTEAKKQGWPWSISKGYDTFCPISEVLPISKLPDPHSVTLTLRVNGMVRQHESTNQLLFSIPQIISYISHIMSLERGDLILTGTPDGVDEIHEGDIIEASLDNLCYLKHEVIRKEP